MKRTNPAEKIAKKRAAWIQRTATTLSLSESEAEQVLATPRRQSLRLNPLKAAPEDTLRRLRAIGWQGSQYKWMPNGYTIDTPLELIRDSDLVTDGAIFIQNAASWLPVLALGPQAGDDILDVCAAPGGKTSHIAAITENNARIWVNDSSKTRLLKMQANLERLGVATQQQTLYDAQRLARHLEGQQFDRILIDAPCSSEGLRNIHNDKDVIGWSVAHIKRLQQEQKRIITQAWQLLAPGGTLIYSTCTMAPEENEAVIDYVLRSQPDATIEPFTIPLPNRVPTVTTWNGKPFSAAVQDCLRLMPSEAIEAFFVGKLRKHTEPE